MSNKEDSRIIVGSDWTGSRLDRFVRASRPALSFPAIQTLIRKGKVLLNGDKVPGGSRLKNGDIVEIHIDRRPRYTARTKDAGSAAVARYGAIGSGIPVIYEDDDLLAIDKPPGLPVQPGNRAELGSALDLITDYLPATEHDGSGPESFTASPVHRLDAGTSGILMVAKTRHAARELSRIFSEGKATKKYLAITEGVPASFSGTIDTPLRTEKGESSRTFPDPAGRPSVTHFSVLRELPGGNSLLEIRIETGRTHQIRVHLQSIGHPVSGDPVYGSGSGGSRLMLHAWKISFQHPTAGGRVEIVSPPPPEFGLQRPEVF